MSDYIYDKVVNGRRISIVPLLFGQAQLTIGQPDVDWWEAGWIYETPIKAILAMARWNPETEDAPEGWIREDKFDEAGYQRRRQQK